MDRRGELLVENVIFIILNLVFLGIMIIFLVNQSSGSLTMEETYAKQIALVVDAARPGMSMEINMKDVYDEAKKNNFPFDKVVSVSNNFVTVKLSDDGGYSYHYFNNVSVNPYPGQDGSEGNYIITVNKNE